MNRRYSAEEYFEKCELLRKYFKNPALTTDVIVGFPGETEEEFEESRAFVDKIDFYETHIFKYSRRAGTKADRMDNQVPEEIKTRRSNVLLELNERKQKAYEESLMGTVQEVLMEESIERDGEIYQVGHTKEYVKIALKSDDNLSNQIVCVELTNRSQIIH
jgi:threonylcarbamoyladenosine tRNA methylthiotransferase MtaB